MDNYTTKFYQLVACADLVELEDQLVSRYIGRMREQFNDSLNFFDFINVSKSQSTSVTLEKGLSQESVGCT